jgi:hypothetical protein
LLAPGQLSPLLRRLEAIPGDAGITPEGLADAWRAAARAYQHLEATQAGAADGPEILRMPAELGAHVDALVASPAVQRTFETVPVSFGMVPLDQLVASQFVINDTALVHVDDQVLDMPALAALCLPLRPHAPDLQLVRQNANEFTFTSNSHDMRLLDVRSFDPALLQGLETRGHVQTVAGLFVGFSANLVTVVRYRNRLVVNNGHHRVQALLRRGLKHAPCLIQVCGSEEEMREASSAEVRDNADLLFNAPRPPLMRDYQAPDLICRLWGPPRRRELHLKIHVESRLVAR